MDDTGAPVGLENLFGAVLRSFRKSGLRQTAAKIPVNFSHLAKWERGERPVPEEMIPALDQLYAANGTLITLHELIKRDRLRSAVDAARTLGGPAVPPPPPGVDDEGRPGTRGLFSVISTATGTPPEVLEALETAEALAGGVRTAVHQHDGVRLADWERLTRDRALTRCTGRPGALLGQLTLDYTRLSRLLAHDLASVTPRLGLLRIAARLATLLALEWADVGQQDLADRYWELSRTAADSTDDHQLRVGVRAQEAHAAYWAKGPSLPVATLIHDALAHADGTPGTGLALAYATGALMAAGRGDAEGTRVALEEFAAIADRLSATPVDEPVPPPWHLPPWAHAYHRAWPSLLLGDLATATQAITEAEKLCPPEFSGPLADLRLYRAHALIAEGDVEHGLRLAHTAVRAWPLTTTRRRILTHLLAILPTDAHPTAQTLHHLLHP